MRLIGLLPVDMIMRRRVRFVCNHSLSWAVAAVLGQVAACECEASLESRLISSCSNNF